MRRYVKLREIRQLERELRGPSHLGHTHLRSRLKSVFTDHGLPLIVEVSGSKKKRRCRHNNFVSATFEAHESCHLSILFNRTLIAQIMPQRQTGLVIRED